MRRRAFIASAGVAAVAGCLGASGSSEDYDVGMSTDSFRPEQLTVSPGTTVVWLNTSKQGHTVTAYDEGIPDDAAYFASGGFASESEARQAWADERGGLLPRGESFQYTFEVPGTYNYVCIPHERAGMVGTVEVTEDADATGE